MAERSLQISYDSSAPRIPMASEFWELWRYRYLLTSLISRNLKVRYKRSVLGFLWAMLNPLLTMTILTVVFSSLFRNSTPHYSIHVLSGLLIFNLFGQGTLTALTSITSNSMILNKIYVPPSVFVASALGSAFINFLYALVPLLFFCLLAGVYPHITWLYLIIPILSTIILAFGIALIIAALTVFFADMNDIYQVMLNAYFYLSPVIYPVDILPDRLRELQIFNPMAMVLECFRTPLLYQRLPSAEFTAITILVSLLTLIVGWFVFTRLEHRFAYHI